MTLRHHQTTFAEAARSRDFIITRYVLKIRVMIRSFNFGKEPRPMRGRTATRDSAIWPIPSACHLRDSKPKKLNVSNSRMML